MRTKSLMMAGGAALLCSAAAMATPPAVTLSVNGDSQGLTGTATGIPTVFNYAGSIGGGSVQWDFNASNMFDPQTSFMSGNFLVRNLTSETQSYEIVLTLPVMASGVKVTVYGGSVAASINGGEFGGSIAQAGSDPFWTASAGGGFSQSLLTDLLPVSASAFESAVVGSGAFGAPIPSLPGPNLDGSLSLTFRFTLDAGVSLAMTSVFAAQVPAPGAIALLAAAGLVAGRRRRN